MARSVSLVSALLLVVLSAGSQAESPNTGTIEGHVLLTTRLRGTAMPSTLYQPRAVGSHEAAAIPEILNVVVSLKKPAFRGPLPIVHQEIRQEHEAFLPRVLAITKGSTVDFPNGDPVFHNVFSLASAAAFDLGRYPMGQSKSTVFTKPGLVKVFCHLHSQMSASIMVFDHPYFTIPSLDGNFTLANVPAGSYIVAGWHERVGERIETVTVTAGRAATVMLSLPVEEEP